MKLSQTDKGIEWLRLFDVDDQGDAACLIDKIKFVENRMLLSGLKERIIERAEQVGGKIGLYAEREVVDRYKEVMPLFHQKETDKGHLRAYGDSLAIPMPTELGSEGVIGSLITQLYRERPDVFFHHPAPNIIRDEKIQSFFLVTDLIGSGGQASSYLSALWKVASVKSWASLSWMNFEVIAYSGTERGLAVVQNHRSKPVVSIVLTCPTIDSCFTKEQATRIKKLCCKKDPIKSDPVASLGFGGAGALIGFEHGCPNNAPRILHQNKKNRWSPLFPKRVTLDFGLFFGSQSNQENLIAQLKRMNEMRLANGDYVASSAEGMTLVLVLAALRKGPRFDEAISRKTGLTIPEIKAFLDSLLKWGWIDDQRRLTKDGHSQLNHLRNEATQNKEGVSSDLESIYYPQQLRVPVESSS